MGSRKIAFDIEIARMIPDGEQDWKAYRPLGISCAATLAEGEDVLLWHGRMEDGDISAQMTPAEAESLVDYLVAAAAAGDSIVTWNGLGFDFDILAEESTRFDDCRMLALGHFDMMFQVFCAKGHALGLDKAARGMGLAGKTPGMKGDLAPRYWAEGRYQEVLEYCAQDVRITLGVALGIEKARCLKWISNRGGKRSIDFSQGLLTVNESLKMPLPDTSWMDNPWQRSKFTGWLD
jgi:hypothetical protein